MLKDARILNLQGANFDNLTQLHIFSDGDKYVKSTLLYGRNGSGKSTIAGAFRKIKGLPTANIQQASMTNADCSETVLTEEEKKHICVFDEGFVNESVRIQEDGLGSIVMLGEQVGLAERIETAEIELKEASCDYEQKKEVVNQYNDPSNQISPVFYLKKIYSVLQNNDGWAGRKRIIDDSHRNASVSENTYKKFINLSPMKGRDELIVEFKEVFDKLKQAKSGDSKISISVPSIPQTYRIYQAEAGNTLLKQSIEHPELTEREKKLLQLVQRGHGDDLKKTAQEFSSPDVVCCPKCHQPLSEQYKNELIVSIEKVLSKEVEDHQRSLQDLLVPEITLDMFPFQDLPNYQVCVGQRDALNQMIQRNNSLLETKINDPYTPVSEQMTDISEPLLDFERNLGQLEEERNTYNQAVTDEVSIKAKLNSINDEIAYWDVSELSEAYDSKMLELEAAKRACTTAWDVLKEKQGIIDDLNAQQKSIRIAIDEINAGLKYVFFDANRIQICVDGEKYKLLCNGCPVKPKDVSAGERNVIGLCYFFTSVLAGKSRETAHSEEYLLIIDDPVSSFDYENRIGILSYMKYEMGRFLLGNINSRVLIMTHDILTAFDIWKVYDEIIQSCKTKFEGQGLFSCLQIELQNEALSKFDKDKKRNEYTFLIGAVYEYACGRAGDQEPYIGNIMRQVLEAFSTFEYKKRIDNISTDEDILSLIESEADREHFRNLMYRLVLNEGSHRYDQTRAMQMDYFSMISGTEKRRTAKEVLCFMRLLNAPHVKAHLGAAALNNIETWCEEIRS